MKTVILLVLFSTGFCIASAQFLRDNVSGQPYLEQRNTGVHGTPLLFEDWKSGVIYLKDGYKADKFPIKFDLHRNELLFNFNDKAFVVQNPVKEFVLNAPYGNAAQMIFRCGYQAFDKYDENTFYQVLQDGPVTLVKLIRKTIVNVASYGTGADQREFNIVETYFIAGANGTLVRIRKDKSSLLVALGDKNGKLEAWMKKQDNKGKTEQELIAAVKALNEAGGN